jgi:hypothetical protein
MSTQRVFGRGRAPNWTRVAGVCGLGWFLLFAVGGIILQGEPPAYDQPIAEARQFFADHGSRYLVGDYLADIAFVFLFLPFVAGLRTHLGAAEKGGEMGSRLVFAGGVATVVVGAASTAFLDAEAMRSPGSTSAASPPTTASGPRPWTPRARGSRRPCCSTCARGWHPRPRRRRWPRCARRA